jgi:hypothetical protein
VKARNAGGEGPASASQTVNLVAIPAEITIVPRNYDFNWSTSGQNIAAGNTVFCSSNSDFTRVLYWRTSDPGGWVDWKPNITVTGNYDIYVYLPDYTHSANITTQARYYLNGSNTPMGNPVDQNQNKCTWYLLGKYPLSPGSYVHMPTGTSENPYRLMSADGMKFVWSP